MEQIFSAGRNPASYYTKYAPLSAEQVVVAKALEERIKGLRLERSMTLKEVATQLGGLTPAAVAHWESGRITPSDERLEALAKVFDVSVDELKGSNVPTVSASKRSDKSKETAEIVMEFKRRIARVEGCVPGQVSVTYSVTRRA